MGALVRGDDKSRAAQRSLRMCEKASDLALTLPSTVDRGLDSRLRGTDGRESGDYQGGYQ